MKELNHLECAASQFVSGSINFNRGKIGRRLPITDQKKVASIGRLKSRPRGMDPFISRIGEAAATATRISLGMVRGMERIIICR